MRADWTGRRPCWNWKNICGHEIRGDGVRKALSDETPPRGSLPARRTQPPGPAEQRTRSFPLRRNPGQGNAGAQCSAANDQKKDDQPDGDERGALQYVRAAWRQQTCLCGNDPCRKCPVSGLHFHHRNPPFGQYAADLSTKSVNAVTLTDDGNHRTGQDWNVSDPLFHEHPNGPGETTPVIHFN